MGSAAGASGQRRSRIEVQAVRAMVLHKQGAIEAFPLALREVCPPEPAAGEVRVRVSACAICRTDLHIIEGDLPALTLPLIPGHQVVGAVDRLGKGCTRLRVGQRVGIAWLRGADGTCKYCRRGRENLCLNSRYTGYHEDGGYAEFATAPEAFAYELPRQEAARLTDTEAAPLLCAGLIGYRALKRADVPAGGKLLLIGFGSSAHVVIQLALRRGHQVYVVTRSAGHRRLCEQLGASWAGDDLGKLPDRMDSAILFAPVGGLVPPALEALERGGVLSLAGIHMSDVPSLKYERHLFYEREVRSVTANTREDGRELLTEAAEANVRPQVRTYALAEANRALQDMKESRIDGTGVLVMEG